MNQWRKGIAEWHCGDTMYLSVPFTWLMPEAEQRAKAHKGRVVAGGPAVKLVGAPWAETPASVPFDVLAMHNPCATFTTRGCPNRCQWCAVPIIEGDLVELANWKPAPMVCDNNILAASRKHFERVIDALTVFPEVDFNQALDARLLTDWHAGQLARLRSIRVRFSMDCWGMERPVADAVARCRAAGLRDFSVYCLVGFNDNHDDALARLRLVESWGFWPVPMRYQPLDATEKNGYLAEPWTKAQMAKLIHYWSRRHFYRGVTYEDFRWIDESMPLYDAREARP